MAKSVLVFCKFVHPVINSVLRINTGTLCYVTMKITLRLSELFIFMHILDKYIFFITMI